MPRGNDLDLGQIAGRPATLTLPATARDKHLYVCGTTGVGKSKFLERLIRQDIAAWGRSKSGLLLLDPHGSLYDAVMAWLARHNLNRPVIAIDLRRDDWVVAYNVLRRRREASAAVVVGNFVEGMAHVWGQSGTDQTPRFARRASNVLHALYEKGHTLLEAVQLTDPDRAVRLAMTDGIIDPVTRRDWEVLNALSPRDFETEMSSTLNRWRRFLANDAMRLMFGQSEVSLDLGRALEEGWIILVNLATERARVSEEDARLFATLLLTDLWTAAKERGKRKDIKPFYVYLDEFQRFVTPTIAEGLDEARGFGLHLTMAHQFPNQLLDAGPNGKRLYNSVMENASSKVVFRLTHEENLRPLAQWLYTGVLNPDEIKHELFSTKVMEYREEYRRIYSEGRTSGSGGGRTSSATAGDGTSGSADAFSAEAWSQHAGETCGDSSSWSESTSESHSDVPTLTPVLGKELSHVQFRSLDEQIFRSMAVLFDQDQRQCVARLIGMKAPVSLLTPHVKEPIVRPERIEQYRSERLAKFSFVLPAAEAAKRLAAREESFSRSALLETQLADEPATAKRQLRP